MLFVAFCGFLDQTIAVSMLKEPNKVCNLRSVCLWDWKGLLKLLNANKSDEKASKSHKFFLVVLNIRTAGFAKSESNKTSYSH